MHRVREKDKGDKETERDREEGGHRERDRAG